MYTQDIASEELLAADVMAGVSALVDYAAVLHRYGGRDFLPDLRDLTADMIWVWGPEDGMESPEGQTELQREYYKRITAAEKRPLAKAFITARQAEAIVRGLSIHAEEMAEQGDLPSGQTSAGGLQRRDAAAACAVWKFRDRRKPPLYEVWRQGAGSGHAGTAVRTACTGIQRSHPGGTGSGRVVLLSPIRQEYPGFRPAVERQSAV